MIYRDKTYKDTYILRRSRLGSLSYDDYLKGDEWLEIKRRASTRKYYSKCVVCGCSDGIQLHHKSYRYIHTKTPMRDIYPVCGDCHVKIHELAKKNDIAVRKATNLVLIEAGVIKIK